MCSSQHGFSAGLTWILVRDYCFYMMLLRATTVDKKEHDDDVELLYEVDVSQKLFIIFKISPQVHIYVMRCVCSTSTMGELIPTFFFSLSSSLLDEMEFNAFPHLSED